MTQSIFTSKTALPDLPDARGFDRSTPDEKADIWQQVLNHSVEGLVGLVAVRSGDSDQGAIVNFRYKFINQIALRDTFRRHPEQLHDITGRLLTDFFPSIRDTALFHTYVQVIETGKPQRVEQHYNVDHRDIWVIQSVAPFGQDGVMLSYSETSDLHQAARRLSRQTNLLNGVLNSSPHGIVVFETIRDGLGQLTGFHITLVNQMFELQTGRTSSYFVGLSLNDIYPIGPGRVEQLKRLLETGQPIHFDEFIPALGRWFNLTLTRLNDGFVATVQDITTEKQVQQQLEETVQELHRSNRNLEQFAYVASHDLQEPLRKIVAFGDVLNSQFASQMSEPASDLIRRMQRSAGRMRSLVQDLLTYARLSGSRDTFGLVDLNQLLASVMDDLEITIQERNTRVDIGMLPAVWGDAALLWQLFQNLMSNALKFQKPGQHLSGPLPHVRVQGRVATDTELPAGLSATDVSQSGRRYAIIEVIDNGIGFDERYLDRIFTIFQRLHGNLHFGGTGVGLAICKKVIDLHGGTITALSREGEGATFVLYLPMQ
ncbi:signal transduction histidine kinase [Spirosoma lacussanchae]|uniref:sensor histidine kinase n=1 Tax=Spirosoma lacussanchae TaxID=1884249 RepID=UPI001108A4DF|nr:ATP-binding protein [Spirosoma lacussanchae]